MWSVAQGDREGDGESTEDLERREFYLGQL